LAAREEARTEEDLMADSFGDLVAEVVNESRRSMSDVISNLILDAIAYYECERFFFNETTQTFSVSSSQDTYTSVDASFIPHIQEFDSLRLTVSANDKPTLVKWTWGQMEDMNYPQSFGEPYAYSYWGQSIRFYPVPDGGYEIRFSGVVSDASLSLSTDVNNWTQRGKGKDLIKWRAESMLYAHYLRDDVNAGRCIAREQQEFDKLKKKTNRAQGTSEIEPHL
jgi:hypothetical protein